MATKVNEILAFATQDTGTNLLTQQEYDGDIERTIGHQPGIARSKLENKVLRQSSLMAAGLAQFILGNQDDSVTDSMTAQQVADAINLSVSNIAGNLNTIGMRKLNCQAYIYSAFTEKVSVVDAQCSFAAAQISGSEDIIICAARIGYKFTKNIMSEFPAGTRVTMAMRITTDSTKQSGTCVGVLNSGLSGVGDQSAAYSYNGGTKEIEFTLSGTVTAAIPTSIIYANGLFLVA